MDMDENKVKDTNTELPDETNSIAPQDKSPEAKIDSSKWFQKDNVPLTSSPRGLLILNSLGKKKLIVIGVIILIILVGGISFALVNNKKPNQSSNENESSIGTEPESDELNSTANDEENTDGTIDNSQDEPDVAQPSSGSGGSNTNTNTGGGNATQNTNSTFDIAYTNNCFSPANITIKKGDTVRFKNNSNSRDMWPATNKHPQHDEYSEFDSKQGIGSGGTYSFTFTKTGSWGYHDHLKPNCGGTITVN